MVLKLDEPKVFTRVRWAAGLRYRASWSQATAANRSAFSGTHRRCWLIVAHARAYTEKIAVAANALI